jgi:hypothetical protein
MKLKEDRAEKIVGLPVGKKWLISSDSLNIILRRLVVNKKTGENRWAPAGYYSTLHSALEGLVAQEVRDSGLSDVKVVCAKLDQIHKDIKSINVSIPEETK